MWSNNWLPLLWALDGTFQSLLPPVFSVLHLSAFSHFLILRTLWLPSTAGEPASSVILVISTELLERYVISKCFLNKSLQNFIVSIFVKTSPACILSSTSFIQCQQYLLLFIIFSYLNFHWYPLWQSLWSLFLSSILSSIYSSYDSRSFTMQEERAIQRRRLNRHVTASGLGSCQAQRNKDSVLNYEYAL